MNLPGGYGNPSATIMLVGEAWGSEEARSGKPFVGMSGQELDRMLHDAGILRADCFVTNLVNAQPLGNDLSLWIPAKKKDITPDCVRFRDRMVKPIIVHGYNQLLKEIDLVKPTLIIALGNAALWALTGLWGITKWRGSQLRQNSADLLTPDSDRAPKVIPTYHPAAVLRQWDWRVVAVNDLRRAARESKSRDYERDDWTFILRPSLVQTLGTLEALYDDLCKGVRSKLSFDLETRAGHIACAGIAWGRNAAICIPFMAVQPPYSYWPEEEEVLVLEALYRVLTHPKAQVIGQNLLYDAQYTWKWWHFIPNVKFDTMIAHHSAWAAAAGPDETGLEKVKKSRKIGGMKKSLDFQASMYCKHYVYWKDDSKNWDPAIGEEQFWRYNCEDAVRTFEIAEVLGV